MTNIWIYLVKASFGILYEKKNIYNPTNIIAKTFMVLIEIN